MKKILDCASISEFLVGEMSRRKRRNHAYSLRAFARDLDVSASRLSEVMSGEVGLSAASAKKISRALGLTEHESNYFFDLVLAGSARNAKVRALAESRLKATRKFESYRQIKEDQFRVISDWYHSAILELTLMKDFSFTPSAISQALGITMSQVEDALKRLIDLELLVQNKDGSWHCKSESYLAFSETPSAAIRKFHRQVLSMAIESVLEDHMSERELTAMVLAIPKNLLPEFRDEMRKFMTDFWKRIENEPKDELYTLSVQLCPVRNRRRNGGARARAKGQGVESADRFAED